MPVNSGGNHWVFAVINLTFSVIAIFDSMHSLARRDSLYQHMAAWTEVLNQYLTNQGFFEATNREPFNFSYSYNDSNTWGFTTPQQANGMDCGVIACWLATQFSNGAVGFPAITNTSGFFRDFRYTMAYHLYATRCEDTTDCGYD